MYLPIRYLSLDKQKKEKIWAVLSKNSYIMNAFSIFVGLA